MASSYHTSTHTLAMASPYHTSTHTIASPYHTSTHRTMASPYLTSTHATTLTKRTTVPYSHSIITNNVQLFHIEERLFSWQSVRHPFSSTFLLCRPQLLHRHVVFDPPHIVLVLCRWSAFSNQVSCSVYQLQPLSYYLLFNRQWTMPFTRAVPSNNQNACPLCWPSTWHVLLIFFAKCCKIALLWLHQVSEDGNVMNEES